MIQHEGDPTRCVVLLPGVRYFSQAPLLWYARETAQARGWSVVELDERAPDDQEPFEWMRGRAEEALEAAAGAELVVVVGKSLASAAAPMVSGPAVWLTPLLVRPEIAETIGSATAPTLLVGSPDDPTWQQQVSGLADAAQRWTGRLPSVVEISRSEAREGLADREPYLVQADREGWLIAGHALSDLG